MGAEATISSSAPAWTADRRGPGRPSEFTSAFADALLEAVRRQHGQRPDAQVALGWYLAGRLRRLALRLARRVPGFVVAVAVLFIAGVLIALTDGAAAITAGAATILASLGLTWRGVGRSPGVLGRELEQPLRGAELDTAIRQAITVLPRRDVSGTRRGVAIALGRSRDAAPQSDLSDGRGC